METELVAEAAIVRVSGERLLATRLAAPEDAGGGVTGTIGPAYGFVMVQKTRDEMRAVWVPRR